MAYPNKGLAAYWRKRRGSKKSKRRGISMSKKNSTRKKKSFTLPLAVIAGFMPPLIESYDNYKAGGGIKGGFKMFTMRMTGWNQWADGGKGHWYWKEAKGLLTLGIGVMVHKLIGGTLGVNRMLARSGIPFIRL
jgi:hypothetical protein